MSTQDPAPTASLERPPASGDPAPSPPAPAGDAPPPSFGQVLLDMGLLTARQLDRALEVQRERSRRGDFARLGHILVEQGFLTPEQVQEVLEAQAIRVVECEACGARYNVRGWSPQRGLPCTKCRGELRPVQHLADVTVQDQLEGQSGSTTVRLRERDVDSNTARIRSLRILGKYQILGEIARGGMGIIYKARQLDLERTVALKTLRQEELAKPGAAERFRGEAQAVAGLRHPNIVAVHEVGTHDGIEYFTMQFIEGLALDRIALRERLTPVRAVEVVLPIAEALEYAHRHSVVHRDLKPANIIIDPDGVPFLVDWGIAKRITQRLDRDDEEDLLGSIPYMAPEYVEGAAYDERCDLYSLGVVLYEVLAGPGCLPYYDDDTRRFLERIMKEPPRPITERLPDLDPELARIVGRMIAPRAARYAATGEAVADLRRWLAAHVAPLPGPPVEGPPSREPGGARGVGAAALIAAVGVGAAGFAAAAWMSLQLEAMRATLETSQDELSEVRRELRLTRGHDLLAQARAAAAADDLPRALERCDEAIRSSEGALGADPGARGRQLLADLLALRADVRFRMGLPGVEDDRRRADELARQ